MSFYSRSFDFPDKVLKFVFYTKSRKGGYHNGLYARDEKFN